MFTITSSEEGKKISIMNDDDERRPFFITTTVIRKKSSSFGIDDDEIISLSSGADEVKEKKKEKKLLPYYYNNVFGLIIAIIIIIIILMCIIAVLFGTLMTQHSNSLVDGSDDQDKKKKKNVCAGKKLHFPNVQCIDFDGITNVGPQAASNVTIGYNGTMDVVNDIKPIIDPFNTIKGMCPVNVHWHLGAEHLSVGQYDDETGGGPTNTSNTKSDGGDGDDAHARLLSRRRQGHKCTLLYDSNNDPKFTKPYQWKYCDKSMDVGQTYEIHWPYSKFGACGSDNQYQTPFLDGVFCNLNESTFKTLQPQQIANSIGVQAQVFIVVNDESYYYPNLINGMIVDKDEDKGTDVAKYTGSTTGDSFNNNNSCSKYSPITWHVDRKCHMISASSFDKLCYDMLNQQQDMSNDIQPHGSRETINNDLAPNNFVHHHHHKNKNRNRNRRYNYLRQ